MKRYFGTDGIRGQVGKSNINVEFMLKLGWAVGTVLASEKNSRVIIGRDTRVSGLVLQSALQAGLSAAGVETNLLGVLPTPAVAYLTHSLRAAAGIVISASHNPFQDNGVKFFNAAGMKLSDEVELEIEAVMQQPMKMLPSADLGHVNMLNDASGRYIEFCKSTFPDQLTLHGLKIVVDCANGAAFDVAPKVLHELGAEVIPIFNRPDGMNINLNCGAVHLQALQQEVLAQNADVGIALDGDADRLMMVDHQGEVVDGDEILCILAKDSRTGVDSRSGVVGTSMSNLGLEKTLQADGISFIRANVGDRFVLEKLLERGWTLGGESSGHIVNLDYTTTGDGVISALQVLRIMQMTAKSLHDLKQSMKKCPQVMVNVPLYAEFDLSSRQDILDIIEESRASLGSRGRVLVRQSGTERCIRVMVEGDDLTLIKSFASMLAERIEKAMQTTYEYSQI